MTNNKQVLVQELGKFLFLNEEEAEEFLKRFFYFIKKNNNNLSKSIINKGFLMILKDIKQKQIKKTNQTFLKNIKHKCLHQYKKKFLELAKDGLNANAITNYFLQKLKCKRLSVNTVQKALNNLKNGEKGEENG